jgi:hypothetical protein
LIKFYDQAGSPHEGWISERLVDDLGQVVPTLAPTPEFTFTPSSTPAPFQSPTPDGSATAVSTDTPLDQLSEVNIRANCREINETPARPTTNQTISLWWWWWVYGEEFLQQHLDNATYEILIDGQIIENWSEHRTPFYQDARFSNRWTVAWYIPIGKLPAGQHTVQYRVTWKAEITDGRDQFGPGTRITEQISSCTFTVVEAN